MFRAGAFFSSRVNQVHLRIPNSQGSRALLSRLQIDLGNGETLGLTRDNFSGSDQQMAQMALKIQAFVGHTRVSFQDDSDNGGEFQLFVGTRSKIFSAVGRSMNVVDMYSICYPKAPLPSNEQAQDSKEELSGGLGL